MSAAAVRIALYDLFVESGRCPSRDEVAAAAGVDAAEIGSAYQALHDSHVIVLGDDGEPWMVNPFSAVETPFSVEAGGRSFWGNCIWDALGVVAMLGGRGSVATPCPDCGEPLRVDVAGGRPRHAGGMIAHFAVPAAHWWDDIGFT